MSEICPPACVRFIAPGRENHVEGACRQAEAIWTGFLSASEILGVKLPVIDLFTAEGVLLGKAIRKDHEPIHQHPSERNNPTYFGRPTFLVVESPFPELERAIVVPKPDQRLYSRPFGSVGASIDGTRNDARETEQLGGDSKRIDDLLAYIDLTIETHVPEFGRAPSPDELFQHLLARALQDR